MSATTIVYKPLGMLLGAVAGAAAGAAFNRAWQAVAKDDHVPRAREEQYGWGEIMLAAALQGAVFAAVKAAVDRAGAQGVRRVTGRWPG